MIGIIGAGLAGLTAAKVLKEKNIDFVILEKSDKVGGRVKSDEVDGYILDHGFQVLLNSYPSVQKHLDLKALQLNSFKPGAKIFLGKGKSTIMSDPVRDPRKIVATLLSPVSSFKDGIKTLLLKTHKESSEVSTIDFLKSYGFSDNYINGFFKPFFSGIFLERGLKTPANYFSFLFNRFSNGLATLPAGGMGKVTEQLAEHAHGKIRLNYEVNSIVNEEGKVVVNRGEESELTCEKIIVATDAPSVKKLFPDAKAPSAKRVVTTVYFTSDKEVGDGDYLLLNGAKKGRVNHIAFLSNVNSNYSPKGKSLISVNVLDVDNINPDEILEEIQDWGIDLGDGWQHLANYPIHYAQPDEFFQGLYKSDLQNIIFAGDFTETPSIEGAMISGEKAALKAV